MRVSLILIVGILIRVIYLLNVGYWMDTECAVWGLNVSRIFRIDRFTLCYIEILLSSLFILTMYLLGKRILGSKRGGIMTAFFVALGHGGLIKFSITPLIMYNMLFLLGSVLFLLVYEWVEKKKIYILIILGFLAGIMYLLHPVSILYLVPVVIFSSFKEGPGRLFILLASFLILKEIFMIPTTYKVWDLSVDIVLVYLISFIYLVYKLKDGLLPGKRCSNWCLVFLFVTVNVIFTIRLDLKVSYSYIFLYSAFPLLFAFLSLEIKRVMPFIILLQLVNTYISGIEDRAENMYRNMGLDMMISDLKKNGISTCYTMSSLSPIISFLSNEDIIATAGDRKDRYTDIVDSSINPAIIIPSDEFGRFPKYLGSFKKISIHPYLILYDFENQYGFREILPDTVSSSHNIEEIPNMFDRDIQTRWTSDVHKYPGMYIQMDLGKEVSVGKITIYYGEDIQDEAEGLIIEVSNDGSEWKRILDIPKQEEILFWSGPHVIWKNSVPMREYYLGAVKARFIKIIQKGYHADMYWSIREFFIYACSEKSDFLGSLDEVISFLREGDFSHIYSDYWLSTYLSPDVELNLERTAVVIERDRYKSIKNNLKNLGIGFQLKEIGDYYIFYSFTSPLNGIEILPRGLLRCTSDLEPKDAEKAIDGRMDTRWTTHRPQMPGYDFQIFLEEPRIIKGVRLWHKGSPHDYPRGLVIEDVNGIVIVPEKIYWAGMAILHGTSSHITYIFNPVKTKGIKLILDGYTEGFYWSIHEVELLVGD